MILPKRIPPYAISFPLILCLFFLSRVLFAQTKMASMELEMNNMFEQKQYYNLLAAQDRYFQAYPYTKFSDQKIWVSGQRVYTWVMLNDMIHLRKDLEEANETNPSFVDKVNMRMLIDKKALAEFFARHYITAPLFDPARDYRPKVTECDTVRGTLTLSRSCYDVWFYDLRLSINPDEHYITGSNRIFFTAMEPSDTMQIDLFRNFTVSSVLLDGQYLNIIPRCDAFLIPLKKTLVPGEKHMVEIAYAGTPLEAAFPPWNGGFVWKENKGKEWDGVACEHLGASCWWPVKDHLSDKPDSMRITLTVPTGLQAISNGNLRSVTDNVDKTSTFEWFVSYPINSYNVTYYYGQFVNLSETYEDQDGSYQVDYYVLKNHLKKAKKYYAGTSKILEVFGQLYGQYPFPADGAGFVEAPYTGMEHQGAVAIGTVYGKEFRPGISSDYDMLLVHEAAHEWWGNAVAFGDMADAWISEGFATYAEMLFLEKVYGYERYLKAFGTYSMSIVNAWPIVGENGINDNTFLTNDIYRKGAAMLNNLRCIINDDSLFFDIIKGFYTRQKMKITRTEDFTEYVKSRYQGNLDAFFDVFLHRSSPPVLEYTYALTGAGLMFNYRWTGVGKGFSMPFCIVINENQCIRLTGTTAVQNYTNKNAGSFWIPNPFSFDEKVLLPNSFTYFQTNYIF